MLDNITNWLRNPGENMTALGWFAIVGLVLISLLIWSRILRMVS